MKIKDLIEKLKSYPEDMEVVLNGNDHSFVDRLAIYENYAERHRSYIGEALPDDEGSFKVLVIE